MTPEEEVIRAERARQLLEEPLLKEAFSFVRESIVQRIETGPINNLGLNEKLCDELRALYAVKQMLISHVETGKLAEETLKQRSMWEIAKQRAAGIFN